MRDAVRVLRVLLVAAGCLLARAAGPLRFTVEPAPFVFVTERTIGVAACAAAQNVDVRWLVEERDGADADAPQWLPSTSMCPNNRSLIVANSKNRKAACGLRLQDNEPWFTSNRRAFCALLSGPTTLLSRPVRLIRLPELARPTVRSVSNRLFDQSALHLRCQVPHDRYLLQYSWLVDGSPLRPTTFGNRASVISYGDLYIRNVTEADTNRKYNCTAQNTLTGQNHTSFEAPRLLHSAFAAPFAPLRCDENFADASLSVSVGGVAEFTCPLCGYPSPKFTWTSNGNKLQDRMERLGGLLVIRNVQLSDAGDYFCEASNSLGRETFKWTLRVKTPLRVTVSPVRSDKAAGEDAQFHCNVEPKTEVETLAWYHNGRRIDTGDTSSPSELRLTNLNRANHGYYQCIAVRKETATTATDTDVSNDPFDSAAGSVFLNMTKERPEILFITAHQLNVQKDAASYARMPERQLECRAAGIPLPSISWYLDGELLPPNRSKLSISDDFVLVSYINVTVRNETSGRYTCEAANSQGKASKTTLLFAALASGMRQLRNATAFVNSNLTVGCYSLSVLKGNNAVGWKRVVVQPGRGDMMSNIVEDHWISIDTSLNSSSKLMFTSIQQNHAGWYQCDVTDDRQTYTQRLYVTVDLQPSLSVTPVPMQPKRDEALTLNCLVSNANYKTIRWYKDGKLIAQDRNDTYGVQLNCTPQLRGSCIVIRRLDFVHNGIYTCEMEAQYGSETSPPYELSVQYAPQFEDGLPASSNIIDMRVIEGSDVMLDCKASGNPKVSVAWESSDNGRDLKSPQRIAPYDNERFEIHSNDSLNIQRAEASDSNLYRCTASNNFTQANSIQRIFNVSVFVPVRIEMPDSDGPDVQVRVNRTAEMHCRIVGDRPINVTWYHDRKLVVANKKKYNLVSNESDSLTISTLQVASVNRMDSGVYTCSATNKFDRSAPLASGVRNDAQTVTKFATANFSLTVLEPPSKIDEMTVVNWTDSTVELKWKVPSDGHSKINMYLVTIGNSTSILSMEKWVIARVQDYTLIRTICIYTDDYEQACSDYQERFSDRSDDRVRKAPNGYYLLLVDKLEPAFTYVVNVSATNAEGTGPVSTREFTTAEAPPDAPPIIVHLIAKSDTSLFIEWRPPPVLHQRGDLVGYHIHYERCGMAEKLAPQTVPAPPKTNTYDPRVALVNFTLSSLRKFAKYCVRINAFNARGSGPYSPTSEQFTAESVPSESPKSVQCSVVTKNSIKVSWQPPPLPTINGVLQNYTVSLKLLMPDEDEDSILIYQTQQTELNIRKLDPNTNYSVTVQARTRVGDGVANDPLICKTSEAAPSSPRQLRIIQVAPQTVLAIWQPPARTNGQLTSYVLSVRNNMDDVRVSDTCRQNQPEASFFSSSVDCTNNCGQYVCGLMQGRQYDFALAAATLVNRSEPKSLSFTLSSSTQLAPACATFGDVLSVAEGDSVMLNCYVIGRTSRTYWTLDNKEMSLQPGKHHRFENNSLVIRSVNRSDQGNYTCNADDEKVKYEVIVSPGRSCRIPERPRLLEPTCTQNSIQIRWATRSNGNCAISGFNIRWSVHDVRSRTRREVVDASHFDSIIARPTERSKQFAALKCGTPYLFSITANNSVGRSLQEEQVFRTSGSGLIAARSDDLLTEVESTRVKIMLSAFLTKDSCPITSANVTLKNASGFVVFFQELTELETLQPFNISVYPQTTYFLNVRVRSDVNQQEFSDVRIITPAYNPVGTVPVQEVVTNASKTVGDYWNIIVPVVIGIAFFILLIILAGVLCYWRRHRVVKSNGNADRQNSTESNQRRSLLSSAEPVGEATPASRRNLEAAGASRLHASPNSEIHILNASKERKAKPGRALPPRDGRSRTAGASRSVQRQTSDDSGEIKKKPGLVARTIQYVFRTLFGAGSTAYEDVPVDESVHSPAARQPVNDTSANQSASNTLENGAAPGSQSPANDSTLEDLPAGRPNRMAAAAYRHRSASYEARNRPLPTNRHERTTSDRSNMSRSQYYSGGEYATLDDTAIVPSNAQQVETVGIECNKSMMTESWVYSGGDAMGHSVNTAASIDSDGNIQPYATLHLTPKRTRGRTFDDTDPYRLMPHGKGLQPSNTSAFVRPQPARPSGTSQNELVARQRSYNAAANNSNPSDALRQQAIMRRIQSQNDAQQNAIEMSVINVTQGTVSSGELQVVPRIVKPIATNPTDKNSEKQAQQPLIGIKMDSAFRPVPNRYTVRGKDTVDSNQQSADKQKSCDAATSPLDVKSDTMEEGDSNSNFTTSECTASALMVHAPSGSHHRAASSTTMSSNHDELSQLYDSIKGRAQQYTLREDAEEGTLVDGRTHKLTANDSKREIANEDEPVTTCETESSPDGPSAAAQAKLSSCEGGNAAMNPGANEANRAGHFAGGESGGSSDSGIRNFTQLPPLPNEHRQATCEVLLCRPEAKTSQAAAMSSQQPGTVSQKPADPAAVAKTPKKHRKPKMRPNEPCDDIHVNNDQQLVPFQAPSARHGRTMTDNMLLSNAAHQQIYGTNCTACTHLPPTAPILPTMMQSAAIGHPHSRINAPTHPYHTYYPHHAGTMPYSSPIQVPLEYYASYSPLPATSHGTMPAGYGMVVAAPQTHALTLAARPSESGSVYYSSTPDDQIANVLNCVHSAFATGRPNYGISNPVAMMAPGAGIESNADYDSVADSASQEQLNDAGLRQPAAITHQSTELPKSSKHPAVFELRVPKICHQPLSNAAGKAPLLPITQVQHTPKKSYNTLPGAAADESNDTNRNPPSAGAQNELDANRNLLMPSANIASPDRSHPSSEHYDDTIDV